MKKVASGTLCYFFFAHSIRELPPNNVNLIFPPLPESQLPILDCLLLPSPSEFIALKHESRILGHSSNPVCGFSVMEQVRLCAVWPMENWLGSSLNQIQVGPLSGNPTLVL